MKIRMAAFAACAMLICFCAGARGEPKVTIHSEASGIPDNVVAEIIAENPDAQKITFLKCEDASPEPYFVEALYGGLQQLFRFIMR